MSIPYSIGDKVKYIGSVPFMDKNEPCVITNITRDGLISIKQDHKVNGVKYIVVDVKDIVSYNCNGDSLTESIHNYFNKSSGRYVSANTCTCGAAKTYGTNCSKRFHSDWCDLKR